MGILRDTYIINQIDKTDNRGIEYQLSKQNKILKRELETKDRVNVSLLDYTNLLEENKKLKFHNEAKDKFLKELGTKLRIDSDLLLKSKNLKVEVCKNPLNLNNVYLVRFEVEGRDYR